MLFLYNLTLSFRLCSSVPDFLYKVRINDYFFCNFYFFWTNLHYLPLLFFIFSTVFLIKINKFLSKVVLIIILTSFFFLLILLLDTNFMFCIGIELETFSNGVNKLLTNSVNKLHPPLLYYSILWVFCGLGYAAGIYQKTFFYKNIYSISFFKTMHNHLMSCLAALYLGSWWALQEGSWGGWWNWDSSEVFGIIIFFKLIITYHLSYFTRRTELIVPYIQSSCFIVLIFYAFMQLNFGLISHNFSSKNYQLASLDLFYLTFIIISFFIFFKLWFAYKNTYFYFYRHSTTYLNKANLIVKYLIVATLYLSLLPLINNFFWYKINLNVINYPPNFFKITLVLTTILLTMGYRNSSYTFQPLPLWSLLGNSLWVAFFIKIPKFLILSRSLHYILLLVVIHSLFLSSSLNTDWVYGFWLNNAHNAYALGLGADNIYFDFNFILDSNSLEGRSFSLFFKRGISYQSFFITQQTTEASMSTIDLLPSILSSIFLLLYILLFRLLLLKSTL